MDNQIRMMMQKPASLAIVAVATTIVTSVCFKCSHFLLKHSWICWIPTLAVATLIAHQLYSRIALSNAKVLSYEKGLEQAHVAIKRLQSEKKEVNDKLVNAEVEKARLRMDLKNALAMRVGEPEVPLVFKVR